MYKRRNSVNADPPPELLAAERGLEPSVPITPLAPFICSTTVSESHFCFGKLWEDANLIYVYREHGAPGSPAPSFKSREGIVLDWFHATYFLSQTDKVNVTWQRSTCLKHFLTINCKANIHAEANKQLEHNAWLRATSGGMFPVCIQANLTKIRLAPMLCSIHTLKQ